MSHTLPRVALGLAAAAFVLAAATSTYLYACGGHVVKATAPGEPQNPMECVSRLTIPQVLTVLAAGIGLVGAARGMPWLAVAAGVVTFLLKWPVDLRGDVVWVGVGSLLLLAGLVSWLHVRGGRDGSAHPTPAR